MSDARIASKMSERELQDAVLELARYLGWRCYHTHDSRHSAAGFPDLVMVRDTRLIFAELKSERGNLSIDQQHWLAALNPCAEVYAWWPGHWLNGTIERVLRDT